MKASVIVAIVVILIVFGIPIGVNIQTTGDWLGRSSNLLTMTIDFWLDVASQAGNGFRAPGGAADGGGNDSRFG